MTVALFTFVLALQVAPAPAPTSAAKPAASSSDAPVPVEIVVYSDFQCPFCAQFAGPFRELQVKGVEGATVTVQFKHFPLSAIHPAAPLAHQAALAAKAQGRFWEMHDLLFAHQARAQRGDLLGYAKTLGLDMDRFERDLDSEAIKKVIAADIAEGGRLGVGGTPTFFVNGKVYSGTKTLVQLRALVAGAVRTARAAAASGAATVAKASMDVPGSVDLILYSDFQCPFCQQFAQPIRELQARGADGTTVNVEFKHFPLSIHPSAQLAHQAAMAAMAQGKFWEMHDVLFANPQRVQRADLIAYAKQLGLDVARFEQDMDSDAVKQAIAADLEEGGQLGVSGTPSYSINGKMYSGARTLPQVKELLVGEQRRARALAEVSDSILSRGPSDAPVTLEVFADLQSPVTRPALDIVNQVVQRYGSAVRVQFRNFPLAFHPQAALAHEAAMAAARHGRFWELVAYILDHQDSLREQDLIAHAGRLGLDQARFAATLQERRYAPRVDADVATGQSRGVRGSPAIVIGDKRIDGVPNAQMLTQLIEAALAAKQAAATK